jgi:hypothetical protein
MGKFLKMNDKTKNIILKLSKGIVYAYSIGFISLTLQQEYNLLPFVSWEIEYLIDDLFYFGESNDVFDVFRYGFGFPGLTVLTYLFLLIIHFFIRSKIKLKAKQKQKKKTVLRSLVEKIGRWNNDADLNNIDNYSSGVITIGVAALIVIVAIGTINNAVELGDYLIVTDEEKVEMREQEAQNRQREREIQQAVRDKEQMERIAQLLPNAHPNVRKAIEAKGLELSCGGDANYTITFDDLNVYVKGDSNFKYDLELFIAKSGVHDSGFIGDFGSSDIRYERFLDFKNWENWISLEKRVPNTIFQFISMGPAQSSGCRATFKETSNNPFINPALKLKEMNSNAPSASKSIQEIRESVKNRTQDKDQ